MIHYGLLVKPSVAPVGRPIQVAALRMPAKHNYPAQVDSASPKPYVIVGAGRLSAAVWKTPTAPDSTVYRFNIFSLDARNGTAGQCFSPDDVVSLAKLAHVLAAVLVDDGGVDAALRQQLGSLASNLESVFCSTSD